jgi:MtN3 and saliva related transmembrane protein
MDFIYYYKNNKQYTIEIIWRMFCNGNYMEMTQIIGLTAGILTASSMIPQVIKSWKEKKADDVSLKMLIVLTSGIALWIVYGLKKNDLPIILTNIFSMVVNITMVILRLKFNKKKKGEAAEPRLSVSHS